MKRLAVPGAILSVLLACDGHSGGGRDLDPIVDTGAADDTGQPKVQSDPMGTQVGSEGFWDCPLETATDIDSGAPVPEMGGLTPVDIAELYIGDWPLDIVESGTSGSATGSLSVADGGEYLWLTVADGPGCADHLAIGVTGAISRLATSTDPLIGWLAVRPGDGLLILTAEGDLTALEAAWGPPTTPPLGTSQFRVEGRIDEARFEGTAAWADCVDGECAPTDLLATVTSAR